MQETVKFEHCGSLWPFVRGQGGVGLKVVTKTFRDGQPVSFLLRLQRGFSGTAPFREREATNREDLLKNHPNSGDTKRRPSFACSIAGIRSFAKRGLST
jgi:hypothetical protein